MEPTAIKRKINQLVEQLLEELLGDLLTYLLQIEKAPLEKVEIATHFRRILQEDNELLKKLAQ